MGQSVPDDQQVSSNEPTSCREVEAEYTLEYPVRCPFCEEEIDVLRVVRLLRTKVNFTSTLPRRGRVMTCPHCQKLVSAELGGFG